MLRSYLCVYSDVYIVLKGAADLLAAIAPKNDEAEKDFAFRNNVSFISCMRNAEDLDIVMSMYNLLEYSQNYSTTSRRLLGYYRDDIDDVDGNALNGKSFEYEAKIVRNAPERPGNEGDANPSPVPTLNVEVTIPLKYLDNFWISLVLSLINCEIELDLSWKKERVMI